MLIDFYGLDDWESMERFEGEDFDVEGVEGLNENVPDREALGMMSRTSIRERRILQGRQGGDQSIFDFDADEFGGEDENPEDLHAYHDRRRKLIDHYEFMHSNHRIRM